MTDGVVNLLKPPGMTSHDAVSFVRRVFRQKRVGHGGTLDPAAAGVLPVFLGQATRLVEYVESDDKEYRAEILFGVSTDSGDDTGRILLRKEFDPAVLRQLPDVAASFAGPYDQVPPMYSALKKDGRRLYELAREGVSVDRPARRVWIRSLRVLSVSADHAVVHVHCSKGTYIRTLCEDIGERLDLPATMSFLLRTRVGRFEVGQAATLEELAAEPLSHLLPADAAVSHLTPLYSGESDARRLQQGQTVGPLPAALCPSSDGLVRLYSPEGSFFGIADFTLAAASVKPLKIFTGGNAKDVAG